jgi:hypothetical protein
MAPYYQRKHATLVLFVGRRQERPTSQVMFHVDGRFPEVVADRKESRASGQRFRDLYAQMHIRLAMQNDVQFSSFAQRIHADGNLTRYTDGS